MLVELRLVEQRYEAVHEVLEGASVTDVARRHGVARQTLHVWLRRYASQGLAGLADASSKPLSCPHQMAPATEARIVEMRKEHPDWGPRTILYWLAQENVEPRRSLREAPLRLRRFGSSVGAGSDLAGIVPRRVTLEGRMAVPETRWARKTRPATPRAR